MDNTKEKFNERVKRLRKALGLKQQGLAEKSGLSIQMVKDIERGRSLGGAKSYMGLSRALGVSVEELVSGSVFNSQVQLVASQASELGLDYRLLQKIAALGEKEMSIVESTVNTLYEITLEREKQKSGT